jgi:hypothetical protein
MTSMVAFKLIKKFKLNPTALYFSVSATAAEVRGTTANLEEGEWVLV